MKKRPKLSGVTSATRYVYRKVSTRSRTHRLLLCVVCRVPTNRTYDGDPMCGEHIAQAKAARAAHEAGEAFKAQRAALAAATS